LEHELESLDRDEDQTSDLNSEIGHTDSNRGDNEFYGTADSDSDTRRNSENLDIPRETKIDDSVSERKNLRKLYSHKLMINYQNISLPTECDMTAEKSTHDDSPIQINSTTAPVIEEIGRSKRRRALKRIILDRCLCGVVADPASE
jgi:hypothetical protein